MNLSRFIRLFHCLVTLAGGLGMPTLAVETNAVRATYAHKPWILKHQGVAYHFYCAVGQQGRVIALATSHDLKRRDSH